MTRRSTMQPELRCPVIAEHFDVFPQDTSRVASTEGFHCRFLRGKTSRERGNGVAPPHTIDDLAFREDAFQKALPVLRVGRCDARNVGEVDAESDNVHA